MTPDEATAAVHNSTRVRCKYAAGVGTHAEGTVIGYVPVPALVVRTDSGEHIVWRHDLIEVINEEEANG